MWDIFNVIHKTVTNRFGTGLLVRYVYWKNTVFFIYLFTQEIQIDIGVLTVFDVAWQIAV